MSEQHERPEELPRHAFPLSITRANARDLLDRYGDTMPGKDGWIETAAALGAVREALRQVLDSLDALEGDR